MNTPTESTVATSDDEAQAARLSCCWRTSMPKPRSAFGPWVRPWCSPSLMPNIEVATLTGTGESEPGGRVAALFPQAPGLSFASWIAFGLPLSACLVLAAWGSSAALSSGVLQLANLLG